LPSYDQKTTTDRPQWKEKNNFERCSAQTLQRNVIISNLQRQYTL
jgi:hypothetical protein